MRNLRRLWGVVAVAAALCAAAAYVAQLALAHGVRATAVRLGPYAQVAGSVTVARRNVGDEFLSLVVGANPKRPAYSVWRLPALPQGTADAVGGTAYAFLIGDVPRFERADGEATIQVQGRVLARFRGLPSEASGHLMPGAGPDQRILEIPPSNDLGWILAVPESGACDGGRCRLTVSVHGGTWTIQRVGLVLGTAVAQPGALPYAATALWAFVAIVACVAPCLMIARRRRYSPAVFAVSFASLCGVIAFVAVLVSYQAALPRNDTRADRVERLGAEADAASAAAKIDGNALVLDSRRNRPGFGRWQLDSYEGRHDLSGARDCSASVYVTGIELSGRGRNAAVRVELDGRPIDRVRFGKSRIDFPQVPSATVPANRTPRAIFFTPLYQPFGLSFTVPASMCRASNWDVGLVVNDARWRIDRVGAVFRFTPSVDMNVVARVVAAFASFILLLALAAVTFALAATTAQRFGALGAVVVTFLLLCAPLTHDEWDFPIWPRLADLAAFGHGNPSAMWLGTPLWPIVAATSAPVLQAALFLTGHASQEITTIFLKLSMGLALCWNAHAIAAAAPLRLRRWWFYAALLAPVGLFELLGGYRETFGASFALLGFALSLRQRYIAAAFAFALATSITECLIPLMLLPATLALVGGRDAPAIGRALAAMAVATGTIVAEWLLLGAHGSAGHAVVARVVAYRYGGASWFAIADAFHLLPAWVGPHSLIVVAAMFAILAAAPAWVILRCLRLGPESADRGARGIVFAFIGLVCAVFLAYRGIDPNDWYALFAVTAFAFARFAPCNPYPLVLGAAQGLAYYTIVGIGDFVDWTYFEPSDRGLWGVLGTPMLVMSGIVNALIVVLYVASVTGTTRLLFSRGTPRFAGLFVAAALTACSSQAPLDGAVVLGSLVATLVTAHRLFRVYDREIRNANRALATSVGMAAITLTYVLIGQASVPGALTAFAGILVGATWGFGACDVVMVAGGIWMLAGAPSYGYVSIAGWIALSLLVVDALYRGGRLRPLEALPAQP